MKASEVSNLIYNHEVELERRSRELNTNIMFSREKIVELKRELMSIYQQMAKVLLLESPNVQDINQINQLIDQLKSQIADLNNRLSSLKQKAEKDQQNYNQLTAEAEELEKRRDDLLSQDPAFVSLNNKYTQVDNEALSIDELSHQIQEEADNKLTEYDSNASFHYLIQRKFGQPDYRGKWIFRNLDNWLARQIDFPRNFRNYNMLHAMKQEIAKRQLTMNQRLEALSAERDTMIAGAAQNVGLAEVNQQLARLEKVLDEGHINIKKLHEELRKNITGDGVLFESVTAKIAEVMQTLPLDRLNTLTLKTESSLDDELLKRVLATKNSIASFENDIATLYPEWVRVGTEYDRIHAMAQSFINSDLNRSKYHYDIGMNQIETILVSIFSGDFGSRHLLEILKSVRYVPSNNSSSSSSYSSSSSSSSSSSGGFWSTSSSSSSRSSSSRSSSSRSSSSRSGGYSSSSSSGGGSFSSSSSSGGGKFTTTDSF
ncbi:hypothetical protein EKN56_01595 [Limnobaculum zhutongyuii]|uniref:Uncharacterized protein n=1 Tax=Limnobaculum zhutongyuii TaxID=2498113 RepID=A0A411WFY6_9GAMM|nr:hypothetical protein [Limnobaculum zhutongyuii]QBH95210.1 hypothetical protein EKN56_01595 [Limnobaculum zhutongyuii]TQS89171.1 hypothetical protein ELQ32_08305 [Limnobaculum zhutongyuii]